VKISDVSVLVGIVWVTDLFHEGWLIGEKGEGVSTYKPLHYKGVPFHRVVKGFIIQGGDFANGQFTHKRIKKAA